MVAAVHEAKVAQSGHTKAVSRCLTRKQSRRSDILEKLLNIVPHITRMIKEMPGRL